MCRPREMNVSFPPHVSTGMNVRRTDEERSVPTLSLEVLGPVRLSAGPGAAGAPPRRFPLSRLGRRLLVFLLEARIDGEDGMAAATLERRLWPENKRAHAALQNLVYRLRRQLGSGSVRYVGERYALGAVASDAEAFLSGGEVSLWRGGYLEGHDESGRESVQDRLHQALRRRVEMLIRRGDRRAARYAALLAAVEPYDLAALYLALCSLHVAGQRRQLAQVYRLGRARLAEVGLHLPDQALLIRNLLSTGDWASFSFH